MSTPHNSSNSSRPHYLYHFFTIYQLPPIFTSFSAQLRKESITTGTLFIHPQHTCWSPSQLPFTWLASPQPQMYPNYQSFSCLHLSNWTLPEKKITELELLVPFSAHDHKPQISTRHWDLYFSILHSAFNWLCSACCQNCSIRILLSRSKTVSQFQNSVHGWGSGGGECERNQLVIKQATGMKYTSWWP